MFESVVIARKISITPTRNSAPLKKTSGIFYIFINIGMICMGLKTIPNSERVLVQYKFEDEDSVYIKMMTLDGYQDQKKSTR